MNSRMGSIAILGLALMTAISSTPAVADDETPSMAHSKGKTGLTLFGILGVGGTRATSASDCQRYVELAKSDIRSALASLEDGEYETAMQISAEATDMIAKAISCEIASCTNASQSSGCQTYLEDAGEMVRSGFRNVGNHQFGDAADDFGQALGALSTWISCVHAACTE